MSAWKEYKNSLGDSRPWDILNPNIERVSNEEAAVRFSICEKCPEFFSLSGQCRKCACFMKVKTKLTNASCPLGKW